MESDDKQEEHTQRLNIILIETALHIFDHKTGLAYLRVANHPNLNHHAVKGRSAIVVEVNSTIPWVPVLFFIILKQSVGILPAGPRCGRVG